MGEKETQLERWGFGMCAATIILGLALIVIASISISTETPQSTRNIAGGVTIVLGLAGIVAASVGIYKLETLHKFYIQVSKATNTGRTRLANVISPGQQSQPPHVAQSYNAQQSQPPPPHVAQSYNAQQSQPPPHVAQSYNAQQSQPPPVAQPYDDDIFM